MEPVLAISTVNAVIGWVLVGLGGIAVALAIAISTVEAFRKALAAKPAALTEGSGPPWEKVIDAIVAILKELMGKTGGPTFFMGLILIAVGTLVLNDKLL
jgi:hypothetical protein